MRIGAFAVFLALASSLAVAAPGNSGARMATEFRQADADGDGRLSRAEAERSAPVLARHFDAIDANRDGYLTPFELRAWRRARRTARSVAVRARFDEHFRKADADGDGALSRDEAAASLPRVAKKFDRIDGNRDGRLTLEELHAWLDAKRAARSRANAKN